MSGEWYGLVKQFAEGQQLCNCGRAYADEPDFGCRFGCGVNEMRSADHVARNVMKEIERLRRELDERERKG